MEQTHSIENYIVHIWQINLLDYVNQEKYLTPLLSKDELERANRFRFPQHRQRFILARGILRDILSRYIDVPPQDIIFIYGQRGKPYLDNNKWNLQFNVSHSENAALYALTKNTEIGVDLQKIDNKIHDTVAKRFFSQQEYTELMQVSESERPKAFCNLWASKEALIKAVGEGLYVPLGNFSVSLHEKSQWVTLTHAQHTERFYLEKFPVFSDYEAAFATAQEVEKVVFFKKL